MKKKVYLEYEDTAIGSIWRVKKVQNLMAPIPGSVLSRAEVSDHVKTLDIDVAITSKK